MKKLSVFLEEVEMELLQKELDLLSAVEADPESPDAAAITKVISDRIEVINNRLEALKSGFVKDKAPPPEPVVVT